MDPTRTLTAPDDESEASLPGAAQYLIIALDCARPLAPAARLRLDRPQVIVGRGARREWSRGAPPSGALRVALADAWLSSTHLRLVRDGVAWVLEDERSKNGTVVNGVRVERAALDDGDIIEVGSTFLVYRSFDRALTAGDLVASPRRMPDAPQTLHAPWSEAVATLLHVAKSSVPVLLQGDTGTGKEILARAVHKVSGRAGAFVAVNCGAITGTIVESELFGVRKGAFTGANEDRPGLVRTADKGTLLLDEIGALPEGAQVALLRVLQEREVLPVGGTAPIPVDVRVIAAANECLADRVANRTFRADLYARLWGHVAHLPPLRERTEDVGMLIGELLPRLAGERAERMTLSRAAGRALLSYAWPSNVRELEHALASALAVAVEDEDEVGLAHLPEALRVEPARSRMSSAPAPPAKDEGVPIGAQRTPMPAAPASQPITPDAGDPAERDRILAALESCAGNQTRAARLLGISRATLVNKLAIHRIPRPRTRCG